MNREELRTLRIKEDAPENREDRLVWLAVNARDEQFTRHTRWWIERILVELDVNLDDLDELEYGVFKGNWPHRGIAPSEEQE